MAFSLFGKKPTKNETPLVKKVEERQKAMRERAAPPAAPAAPSVAPPSNSEADLDFTQFVPAGSPPPPEPPSLAPPSLAPAPAATASPRVQQPVSLSQALDFSALAGAVERAPASAVPSPGSMPVAPPPASAAPVAPREVAKKKTAKPVDSILCIEVEEGGGHDIPAPIEEGAVLFANGQAEEALQRMKTALDQEPLGAWKLQVWLMVFDLLQHLGRRAEFEELALDFAVKFERSPPLWVEAPPKAPASAGARVAANIALSGTLGAQSANAFQQLQKAAEKQPRLKLDFSKLQGVEPEGAQLLLATLQQLRTAKKDVALGGEAQLVTLLRARAQAGDASVDQAVWLVLLEVYQQLGQMNEFEEAAVDFAVTYEVSPPSFDPAAVKKKPGAGASQEVRTLAAPPPEDDDDDVFRIAGEVAGQNDALFGELAVYAAGANPVTIDMKTTRRIDFVNAGRLLNVLEKLKAEDKPILIRGVGEMIVALFAVMGIPKVARIIPRK